MKCSTLFTAATLACSAFALSPAQWRSQSIYQVVTDRFARSDNSTSAACDINVYCGGTWRGIINHLPYIQNMGFTAIWISPVVEGVQGNTLDGTNYHGYWAQNIYQVNTNFGSAADLVALSKALHARGMYLMVDVVTNHMGSATAANAVNYSIFHPFNSSSYYHTPCSIDYANTTSIQVCWEGDDIVSLPDLRTENALVLNMWEGWIKSLVANYTIDGLRFDSAQNVNQAFLPPFEAAAGMYTIGEVFNGDPARVCPYQGYVSGLMNYPAWYWITQAFESTSGSMSNLVNGLSTMKSECSDTTLLASFLENHDNPRFPSLTSDMSLVQNAIAFTMLTDGIPIVYQGQEQHLAGSAIPFNREAIWLTQYNTSTPLYKHITALNQIRTRAIKQDTGYLTYPATPVYYDQSSIVMRKGSAGSQVVSVLSNSGAHSPCYTLTLTTFETGFTAKQSLVEILGCTFYTTDSLGNLEVSMSGGAARVFYPTTQLRGSGICPSLTSFGSTNSSSTVSTKACPTTCSQLTSVAILFEDVASTVWGETIKVVGSVPALQNWNPNNGIALSAWNYTIDNHEWYGTVSGFTAGSVVQYKYVNVAANGTVTWEAGPNHTVTVPSCVATATVKDTWQTS